MIPGPAPRPATACPADEVISALQKSIRRGLHEQAIDFAYEMYISSPQLEEKLWRRLIDHLGGGHRVWRCHRAGAGPFALSEMRKNYAYADGDRPMFFMHAIRYSANAPRNALLTA